MKFFELSEEYNSYREFLNNGRGNSVNIMASDVTDMDRFSIRLVVGEKAHQVVFEMPAYGAPDQILEWFEDFKSELRRLTTSTRE